MTEQEHRLISSHLDTVIELATTATRLASHLQDIVAAIAERDGATPQRTFDSVVSKPGSSAKRNRPSARKISIAEAFGVPPASPEAGK